MPPLLIAINFPFALPFLFPLLLPRLLPLLLRLRLPSVSSLLLRTGEGAWGGVVLAPGRTRTALFCTRSTRPGLDLPTLPLGTAWATFSCLPPPHDDFKASFVVVRGADSSPRMPQNLSDACSSLLQCSGVAVVATDSADVCMPIANTTKAMEAQPATRILPIAAAPRNLAPH